MQTSARKMPTLLKVAGLILVSGISGVYAGWSAIGQIDRFYYTPRPHGIRPVPDQVGMPTTYGQPGYASQLYGVDYPYAPVPPTAPGIDPAAPLDLLPPAQDVAADSNLRMAAAPEPYLGSGTACTDCGGPYEEITLETDAESPPPEAIIAAGEPSLASQSPAPPSEPFR